MKPLIRPVPTSATFGRRQAPASPSSGRLSSSSIRVDGRNPARRRLGRSPPASIDAMSSGASLARSWRRARSASRRARQSARSASLLEPVLAESRAACASRPAACRSSLPTKAWRKLPGVAVRAGRWDRSHRRSPNRDRPAPATRRRRGRRRSGPTASRCCGGQHRRPRLEGAKLRRRRVRSAGPAAPSRSPVARPKRQAVSVSTGSHSIVAARPLRARADDLLGKREVDPADAAVAPRLVDHRAAAFRLAGKRGAHRLDQRAGSPGSTLRMPSSSGHSAGGSALASALCTATWTIFGVKRSVSTPATSIRAASASPIRSSSQARSATQSTGIDVRRRVRPWRAARRAARYAPSATRAACPSAASGSTGTRRSRRPTASAPRPSVCAGRARRRSTGRAAPSRDIRPAGAAGKRRCRRRFAADTSSTALSSAPPSCDALTAMAAAQQTPSGAGGAARAPAAARRPAAQAPASRAQRPPPTRSGRALVRIASLAGHGDLDRLRRLLLRRASTGRTSAADDEQRATMMSTISSRTWRRLLPSAASRCIAP